MTRERQIEDWAMFKSWIGQETGFLKREIHSQRGVSKIDPSARRARRFSNLLMAGSALPRERALSYFPVTSKPVLFRCFATERTR